MEATTSIKIKVVYRISENKRRCVCMITTSYSVSGAFGNERRVNVLRNHEDNVALFTLTTQDIVTLCVDGNTVTFRFNGNALVPMAQTGMIVVGKRLR